MAVLHRRQAEGSILSSILLVSNPDEGRFQQADNSGKNLLPRQSGAGQVAFNPRANPRQGTTEQTHPVILCLIAYGAPSRMISILFTSSCIDTGRLQMTMRDGTDPDITPSRRDRKRFDAGEYSASLIRLAIGAEIDHALPRALRRIPGPVRLTYRRPALLADAIESVAGADVFARPLPW